MNKKESRQLNIMNLIKKNGKLSNKALASMLDVSVMTVRRDLEELSGRTSSVQPAQGEGYDFLSAIKLCNEKKDRIGKFAASLIQPNDVIIIDTGSTTVRILPYIPDNYNLTILCYNANVLSDLRYKAGVKLLCCGGVYHPNTELLESPEGISLIERTRAHKLFLSAAGVHETHGITCADSYETPTKRAAIKSAAEIILVADSGKFGLIQSSYFCDLNTMDTVITDSDISEEWRTLLQEQGCELHIV